MNSAVQTPSERTQNREPSLLERHRSHSEQTRGGSISSDQECSLKEWLGRWQAFGFAGANADAIRRFTRPQTQEFISCVRQWELEHVAALCGNACEPPTLVPNFLKKFDGATPQQFTDAAKLARGAKIAGHTAVDNPFPPDTVLRTVWMDAFDRDTFEGLAGRVVSASPPSGAGAIPLALFVTPLPTYVPMVALATEVDLFSNSDQTEKENTMTKNSAQAAIGPDTAAAGAANRLQQLEIDAIWEEMEQALEQQSTLEPRLTERSLELQELRMSFDKAGKKARQAMKRLLDIRTGNFGKNLAASSDVASTSEDLEEAWEQRIAAAKRSLKLESIRPAELGRSPHAANQVRHPNGGQSIEDQGARFDLNVLQRGILPRHTRCREGFGLTARQIEKLKDGINGTTIADLEKFQRETFNWDQAIKGFGPEGITHLQDAQLELRTKFPMPTADDIHDVEPHSAASVAEQARSTSGQHESLDVDEAEEDLDDLIYRCAEIEREITNLEGIRYLRGVRLQAQQLLKLLQVDDEVTSEQLETIHAWQGGVEAWSSGVNADEEADLEGDEDADLEDDDVDDEDFDEDDDFEDEDEEDDDDFDDADGEDDDFEDELDDDDFDNEADAHEDLSITRASLTA
jgi:hypothetical protein